MRGAPTRTVGASRYSNTKIKRSKDVRAGRLGALRRSTFNWCRRAITSPSSALLDRKRSRRIHLSRLKSSSTRRSSPDSGAQTKWMGFAVGTTAFSASSRAVDLNGETKRAKANLRSPITRSAYAIRPPQWNEVFGTHKGQGENPSSGAGSSYQGHAGGIG